MTVRTALLQGQQLLENANVGDPRLTAEVLLMRATGHDRAWLYAHGNDELIELWWIHYGRYLHQRIKGEPTQYITGRQEFYGREFRVTPDVLIPRPETEHVVEAALAHANATTILDIGTGSGAIAVTLALETKARVVATDVSLAALRIASAERPHVERTGRVRRLRSGRGLRGWIVRSGGFEPAVYRSARSGVVATRGPRSRARAGALRWRGWPRDLSATHSRGRAAASARRLAYDGTRRRRGCS